MSLEINIIDHFTCTSLVFYQLRHCVSSSTFCLFVKLGKVVERNSSQRVEKVKPGNFGLVSILSHTLYISLEPRLIDFSVVKILENIWGCEQIQQFSKGAINGFGQPLSSMILWCFLKAFSMIFYKQFKNVFGMFYVCITGHLACIRASADSQRPMLKGLSRKPGRQLWISWPKGNCPGKCIFRTQLRMQELLFIGLDWKAKQKTNSPVFFLFLCSAWLRLRTSLNYLWPVVSGGQFSSGSASLCATG